MRNLVRNIASLAVVAIFGLLAAGSLDSSPSSPSSSTDPQSQGSNAASEPAAPKEVPPPPQAVKVSLKTLLSEYENNEVRADANYKEKYIEITGKVGEVKKDILGDVYITIGTGRAFEIPAVQCFVEEGSVSQAASYSKGDKVTVRGRVEGLMMNVLIKDCTFVGK